MHRERQNKTREDAFERVLDAKMGYLSGATDEFLESLDGFIADWHASVKAEMQARVHRVQRDREVD